MNDKPWSRFEHLNWSVVTINIPWRNHNQILRYFKGNLFQLIWIKYINTDWNIRSRFKLVVLKCSQRLVALALTLPHSSYPALGGGAAGPRCLEGTVQESDQLHLRLWGLWALQTARQPQQLSSKYSQQINKWSYHNQVIEQKHKPTAELKLVEKNL